MRSLNPHSGGRSVTDLIASWLADRWRRSHPADPVHQPRDLSTYDRRMDRVEEDLRTLKIDVELNRRRAWTEDDA